MNVIINVDVILLQRQKRVDLRMFNQQALRLITLIKQIDQTGCISCGNPFPEYIGEDKAGVFCDECRK